MNTDEAAELEKRIEEDFCRRKRNEEQMTFKLKPMRTMQAGYPSREDDRGWGWRRFRRRKLRKRKESK